MQSSSASTENSDAANSAQILVAVEAKSKAKVKPKAKKKQAVQGSAADKLANSQRDFLLKFQEKLDKALTLGRGCLSCGQDCLDRVKSFRSKLCDWRREFQGLLMSKIVSCCGFLVGAAQSHKKQRSQC